MEQFCKHEQIDVICLSEHWLRGEEVNLYVPQGYLPASIYCRKITRNGGTGIFIKQQIDYKEINVETFCVELDCEICSIKLVKLNMVVISLYRSPQGKLDSFFQNFELALKKIMNSGSVVVVCGDFNIEMATIRSQSSVRFLNLLRSLNLTCTIKTPTRMNSCIDNILVNVTSDNYSIISYEGHFADHNSHVINLNTSYLKDSRPTTKGMYNKTFIRKQTDVEIFCFVQELMSVNWKMIDEFIGGEITVEQMFDGFFRQYVNLWHFSSPLIKKCNKPRNKVKLLDWYNDDLSKEKNYMLSLYNVYKNLRNKSTEQAKIAYNAYIFSKRKYRCNLIEAKKQAYENFIESAPNRCKAAWDVIKREESNNTNEVILNPEVINNFFLNSVLNISNNIPQADTLFSDLLGGRPLLSEGFQWRDVRPEEIVKVVKGFSNSKSMDFYCLSNYVVKRTIDVIKHPLSFILSRCLEAGYFSDLLKISKVVPIYKKGNKQLPQNYRPVSIVPIFSKIIESLMHNQLYSYFENHNLLSKSQFGFRVGRSTTDAVMEIVNYTLSSLDNKESVAISLMDLTRAFDCVPYNVILQKLEFYGVSSQCSKIVNSYLLNRKQYVSVRGIDSSVADVTMGVPQGSVLGPFLFTIAINDLPRNVKVESIVYADDTTIFTSDTNIINLQKSINSAEIDVLNWFSSNKLLCNKEKTQHITISLSKENQNKCSVKLLGIVLDSKLDWSIHINNLCAKISRVSYLFWKLRGVVSLEYLRMAYFGLFQSHISYGLILWGHSPMVKSILLIQKKVIRTISGAGPFDHCRPLFIKSRILTIINLYIFHTMVYVKNNLRLFIFRKDIHTYDTRNKCKLNVLHHRLHKTGSSYKVLCVKFFNKLDYKAHTVSIPRFKDRLYNWLLLNPFYSIDEFIDSQLDLVF